MRYAKKIITLKDGRSCALRSQTAEDAEGVLAYLRQTSVETNFVTRYLDEVTMTIEEEAEFLTAQLDDPREVMVAAFVGGGLVACAGINKIAPREKYNHRAEFGISIIREFWNLGLGSALLTEIIAAAKAAGYEQLELEVVAENVRAIALYEKFGFETYGTRENSVKFRDGGYGAYRLMLKKL